MSGRPTALSQFSNDPGFIELSIRKVEIAGIVTVANGLLSMTQIGRNLTDAVDGILGGAEETGFYAPSGGAGQRHAWGKRRRRSSWSRGRTPRSDPRRILRAEVCSRSARYSEV